jgi:hypothetical protein
MVRGSVIRGSGIGSMIWDWIYDKGIWDWICPPVDIGLVSRCFGATV